MRGGGTKSRGRGSGGVGRRCMTGAMVVEAWRIPFSWQSVVYGVMVA